MMRQADRRREQLKVLDLAPQAGWREVQGRYRQLVLAHHPDVNPSKRSSERFRRIAAAYEVLAALQRERRSGSAEELERMNRDPRVRRLSLQELEMRLLYSASPQLRAAAARLLGKREGSESRRMLRDAARDRETRVRQAALQALGEIGKPGDLLAFGAALLDREQRDVKGFFTSAARIWLRALNGIYPLSRLKRWLSVRPEERGGSCAWEERR